MKKEGPYLPIDTKTNFTGVWFGKSREWVVGGGCNNPPPPCLDVFQKIAWLDERGLSLAIAPTKIDDYGPILYHITPTSEVTSGDLRPQTCK